MAPVAHWSESDYYAASRRARAAWEATQPQLTLGLEGADAGTTSLVASAPSSPNDGLAAGESSDRKNTGDRETGRDSALTGLRHVSATETDGVSTRPWLSYPTPAASPPSPHADGTHSDHPPRVGEGGLENPTTRETP